MRRQPSRLGVSFGDLILDARRFIAPKAFFFFRAPRFPAMVYFVRADRPAPREIFRLFRQGLAAINLRGQSRCRPKGRPCVADTTGSAVQAVGIQSWSLGTVFGIR